MSIADLYKTDWSFEVNATGDIDRISGVANLKKAIERRIITTPGSLVHRPGFGVGLKNFQNSPTSLSKKRKLATLIKEQCEQDSRVEKVLGVSISEDSTNTAMTLIVVRVEAVGLGEQTFEYKVGDLP